MTRAITTSETRAWNAARIEKAREWHRAADGHRRFARRVARTDAAGAMRYYELAAAAYQHAADDYWRANQYEEQNACAAAAKACERCRRAALQRAAAAAVAVTA
jgi:hypothetical protein